MPPRVDKEVVFFLINVGKNSHDGDMNYFEKAKEVMTLIIEKKIFLRPHDEIGIMLAAYSSIDDVEEEEEEACTKLCWGNYAPTWKTVKDVQKLEKSDKIFDDWSTALSNTFRQIKETVTANRVILILLFDCDSNCSNIEAIDTKAIVKKVLELKIQLLWIGSKPLQDLREDKLNESEKLLMNVIKRANGEYMTIDKTLPSLRIFKKTKTRFIPWKCDLEIGDIKIPIAMYVQATAPIKKPSFQTIKTKVIDNEEKSIVVKPAREYVNRYKQALPREDTISGYMYGRKCIPVPETDKAGMNYKSGPKSLKFYGFVPRKAIALEDLCGNTSRIVIPQTKAEEKPFYCLALAMKNADRLAIVRRIYQLNNCPKMGILIPHIVPGDFSGFIYIEILYDEDRRVQKSRPLSSVKKRLTKDKENAIGNLIDSMMLTSTDDKSEPFYPGTVHSPGWQHFYNCMIHRALNPEKRVPKMQEYLKKLLEPPESIKINSKPIIEDLRNLFPIQYVQVSTKKPTNTDTIAASVPKPSQVQNIEKEVEEKMDSYALPEDSNVDLDELFDEDMAM